MGGRKEGQLEGKAARKGRDTGVDEGLRQEGSGNCSPILDLWIKPSPLISDL